MKNKSCDGKIATIYTHRKNLSINNTIKFCFDYAPPVQLATYSQTQNSHLEGPLISTLGLCIYVAHK